jgi:putative tricarboxylic transport membrane protein
MVDNILLGLSVVFTLEHLTYVLIGCLAGTIVGILPGLGPAAAISIVLPLTYYIDPLSGLMMLAGIYYGTQYGGSITSILLKVPGESSTVMTCIDGYALTQKGKPGLAIFGAGISSFVAGIFTTIMIAVLAPPLAELAFEFGPAEYTALMLLGFVGISAIATDDMIKSIGVVCMGILIGTIGTDTITGTERFSFNSVYLLDGIGFSAVAIGLFALSEMFKNIANNTEIKQFNDKIQLLPTLSDLKRMIAPTTRGTLIGSFLGLLPGGGITVSSYAAYAVEKKASKNKNEMGKGAIEGVCAPEAANNASAQAGYVPLLALGLPENAVMAIMLGAFMMYGIVPGPMMMTDQPDIFWGLVISMLVGNLILLLLNVPFVRLWVQVLRVPYHLLYPFILFVCCVGAYTMRNSVEDIIFLGVFGLLGYTLVMFKVNPVPFMLGFVLGPKFEIVFRRALSVNNGDFSIFIDRPISLGLLCFTGLFLLVGINKYVNSRSET